MLSEVKTEMINDLRKEINLKMFAATMKLMYRKVGKWCGMHEKKASYGDKNSLKIEIFIGLG